MQPGQSGTDGLVRDIRHLFMVAGVPESVPDDPAGRYSVSVYGNRVRVRWFTENAFYDQAGQIGVSHPYHPVTRLDRAMIAVMERTMADILYAGGFTVTLRPAISNADPEKECDPEVIVVAGRDFRAWAV